MQNPLQTCIENFGPAPRNLSLWNRLTYLRVPRPRWLRANPSDDLSTLFGNVNRLFSDGVVVWGHIVQANSLLFKPGPDNCPGELVYSLDERCHPGYLQDVARQLFALKGTQPTDPELLPIAAYLTDERIRVFGLDVPEMISSEVHCQISTTFFVRKHLPNQQLCAPILPIVVQPGKPHVAMPLPEKYWPEELKNWWAN